MKLYLKHDFLKLTFLVLLFFCFLPSLQAQKNNDSAFFQPYFQEAEVHFTPQIKDAAPEIYLQRFITGNSGTREIQFTLEFVKERNFAATYAYQQKVNGLPVLDAVAKVNIPRREAGSVVVSESFVDLNDVSVLQTFSGADVYFWSEPDLLIPAKKVMELNQTGISVLKLVDANGEVLMTRINGAGSGPATAIAAVFNPNPITTANTVYGAPYVDNNDASNSFLDAELDTVILELTYDSTELLYKLINDHVIITEHSPPNVPPATSVNDTFFFVRSDPEFEDVNAFYHITEFWKYLEVIGYETDVDDAVEVDADALFGQDMSLFDYTGGTMRLSFGSGGVDDAEDADVIIHEYGHAVSYSIAPESNQGTQRQAIDEGLCDYLAVSYSRDVHPHDYRKVFNWDGHNEFWDGRVAWTNRVYPDELENRIYNDAPMWSGALVHVENNLGRDLTHQLLFESMYSYVPFLDMEKAARLILRADTLINGGDDISYLAHIFAQRGFIELPSFPPPGDLVGLEIRRDESVVKGQVKMINSAGFAAGASPLSFEAERGFAIQSLSVFSMGGQQVYNQQCNNEKRCSLPPEKLKSGVYIVGVNLETGVRQIFKVIVL